MPVASRVVFNTSDLQYPSDATPARYRHECYERQADLIRPAVKQDYGKESAVCDDAGIE